MWLCPNHERNRIFEKGYLYIWIFYDKLVRFYYTCYLSDSLCIGVIKNGSTFTAALYLYEPSGSWGPELLTWIDSIKINLIQADVRLSEKVAFRYHESKIPSYIGEKASLVMGHIYCLTKNGLECRVDI